MSKLTSKLSVSSKKMVNAYRQSLLFSLMVMVIFLVTTGFSGVSSENSNNPHIDVASNFSLESNTCMLSVDAGDDAKLCGEGGVTLTATVSDQSECVDCTGEYGVENTDLCNGDHNYVLYLSGDRYFSNVDLEWKEFGDGTATLTGTVFDYTHTNTNYEVDVTFSGKTSTPGGSPKDHVCHTEDSSNWMYYTDFTGTITRADGTWSTDISRRGPAFQLGNGANQTETQQGKYGACGWFDTTDSTCAVGDFNINLGDCITTSANEVSYLWSTGETTPSITVDQEGTYSVTVTDCKDCTKTDTVEVTTSTLDVNAGEDQEICDGDEATLTATVSGQSECVDCTDEYSIENTYRCGKDLYYVLWLKDDTNNIVRRFSNVDLKWQELADGTATLKGTVVDNNDSQVTLEIDVTYSGKTSTTPQDSPKDHFCHTESADGWIYYTAVTGTISQTDGSWSFDISRMGPSFQLGNGANVTEDEVGKLGASGWFNTTDSNFERGDFNINIGDCITTSTNDVSYLWSTGETTPSITVTESGNYTVTVKDCKDCEDSDSVEVTFSNPPTVNIGEDQQICKGEDVTLVAEVTGAGDCEECVETKVTNTDYCRGDHNFVAWLSNEDGSDRRWFSNIDLVWKENQDGTISLTGTMLEYTTSQATFEVDVTYSGRTVVTPAGSPKDHFCNDENTSGWVYYTEMTGTVSQIGGPIVLNLSKRGAAFQLGNGANVYETEVAKYGGSGWFTVSDSEFTKGDFNINLGDCVTTQSNGIEYLWSTGETTQSITVSPEADTNYSVKVSGCNTCGEAEDEVLVSVVNLEVALGDDQAICVGDSATLTASEGDSYEWSTGETTQSITVSPEVTTEYSVTVTKGACSDNDAVTVSVTNFDASAGDDQAICVGGSATLTASEGDSYEWSTGETTQSIIVSPEVTTEYSVTVTKGVCSDSDAVTVSVTNFDASAGDDQAICVGGSATLTASEGDSYEWSTGETTQSVTVSPEVTTEYSVTVTKGACSDSDAVTVSITNFDASAGDDQAICVGGSATLTASEGDSYGWSTGETTQSITVSPEVTTEYSVIITKNGCQSTDAVVVNVTLVTADAGADVTITEGDSTVLTANEGDTYLWSTGEETQSITVTPEVTTEYSVTVFKDGCKDVDSVIVTVEAGCTVVADAGVNMNLCIGSGGSVILTAEGGDFYEWSTGETTQSIEVSPVETTEYTVTVTKDGCSASDSDTVTVFLRDCGGGGGNRIASVYPTVLKSGTKVSLDLALAKKQTVRISLYDLSGAQMGPVVTKLVEKGEETVDVNLSELPQLSAGVYMLNVVGDGWSKMKKIVVSNRSNK